MNVLQVGNINVVPEESEEMLSFQMMTGRGLPNVLVLKKMKAIRRTDF